MYEVLTEFSSTHQCASLAAAMEIPPRSRAEPVSFMITAEVACSLPPKEFWEAFGSLLGLNSINMRQVILCTYCTYKFLLTVIGCNPPGVSRQAHPPSANGEMVEHLPSLHWAKMDADLHPTTPRSSKQCGTHGGPLGARQASDCQVPTVLRPITKGSQAQVEHPVNLCPWLDCHIRERFLLFV
jgi:hypothetical protein